MQEYIDKLQKYGDLSFTIQEAVKALRKPKNYVLKEIHKLKKKGIIISPLKVFILLSH